MKAHEAVIAWTPVASAQKSTRGQVEVGPLVEDRLNGWTEHFEYVGGAYDAERRNWRGLQSILEVFWEFHTMVVRDGINPQVAHQEFLKIDEYAETIDMKIPGARGRGTRRGPLAS